LDYSKTILCLANSWKKGGRCIAGREVADGEFGAWIRPVSERSTEEISAEEYRYENGKVPRVLDILTIPMRKAKARHYQSENHLIDQKHYWEHVDSISWKKAQAAVEKVDGPLWINGSSSYYGLNDRVLETTAKELDRSLYLIRPKKLKMIVATEGKEFGESREKLRAHFELNGHQYIIAVTDPWADAHYHPGGEGETPLAEGLLCVSLGEVHRGYAYKLAAAVITEERATEPR
jgi:hypothetical protein